MNLWYRIKDTILINNNDFSGNNWIYQGISWGLFMFIIMGIIFPFCLGNLTVRQLLISIPVWAAAGLSYGLTMKLIYKKSS